MTQYMSRSQQAIIDAASLSRIIFVSNFDEDGECSICMTTLKGKSVKVTPCRHLFHSKCLRFWTEGKEKDSCPNCRASLGLNIVAEGSPVQHGPPDPFIAGMITRIMSSPSNIAHCHPRLSLAKCHQMSGSIP